MTENELTLTESWGLGRCVWCGNLSSPQREGDDFSMERLSPVLGQAGWVTVKRAGQWVEREKGPEGGQTEKWRGKRISA